MTAPSPMLPRFARGQVLLAAAGAFALLMVTAAGYGYHRDELYFVEASRHLAWGYVDQPPLSVALVWLSRWLFGDSLVGLRLFPAVADAATVVFAGLTARELGGGRFAQGLAALSVAAGGFLVAGHLAGPTAYDFLAWAVVVWLVVRILRGSDPRLWLVVGLVVGIALLDKETILLLVGALVVGLLVGGQWQVLLRGPWLWVGVVVAVALWSPNLAWQVHHHWPSAEMSRNLRREHSGLGVSLKFVPIQILLPGWWVAPVWLAGLWGLWREARWQRYRSLAIAYAVLFVLLLVFIGDRPYYLAGLYPALLAAGACVAEAVVVGERRFFVARAPRRRWVWRSPAVAVGWVLVCAVVTLPAELPVLPASVLATVPLQKVNYNIGETVGWEELVATVGSVARSLPPSTRRSLVIVTGNYGEAGAVDRYGGALGLPRAFSGHNSYWWWGPPSVSPVHGGRGGPSSGAGSPTTAIAVGWGMDRVMRRFFGSVTRVTVVRNRAGVDNDEEGAPVFLCRGQQQAWPVIWTAFRHYG